jgi:hypothetical protein
MTIAVSAYETGNGKVIQLINESQGNPPINCALYRII